jgi:hypothetical protein
MPPQIFILSISGAHSLVPPLPSCHRLHSVTARRLRTEKSAVHRVATAHSLGCLPVTNFGIFDYFIYLIVFTVLLPCLLATFGPLRTLSGLDRSVN